MRKTYTFSYALGTMTLNLDNYGQKLLTSGDVVYLSAQEAIDYSDYFTVETSWKTVTDDKEIAIGSATETDTLIVYDLTAGVQKLINVKVIVDALSAATLPTGSVATLTIKNSAGDTVETRTHTFSTIAASANEEFNILCSGWLDAETLTVAIAYKQDGSAKVTVESAVVTIDDIADDVAGAYFTIGASVAATNPIVTTIQLVDENGDDLDRRALVQIVALANFDTLASLTALDISTDGTNLGELTANAVIDVLSEVDGDIGITATNGSAGSIQLGVKIGGVLKAISDKITWSA